MTHDDHLRMAEALYERTLQPGSTVAEQMTGLAFDFAVQLRDFEGEDATRGVAYVGDKLGQIGWMGLAIGFTGIIGTTTPELRDGYFDRVDEYSFSPFFPSSRLSARDREQRRIETRHGLSHTVEWLARYQVSPTEALAYWLGIYDEPEVNRSRCHARLISMLGILASRRLRPAIAL